MTSHDFQLIHELAVSNSIVSAVMDENSGSIIAISTNDRQLSIFEIGNYNPIYKCTPLFLADNLQFSLDSRCLVFTVGSGTLNSLDIQTKKSIGSVKLGQGALPVSAICNHTKTSHWWAVASLEFVRICDLKQRSIVNEFEIRRVSSLRFSPHGCWLALGGEDCSTKLLDIQSGSILGRFVGHSASITDVRFHPSEFLLCTSSADKMVRFWDLDSKECVTTQTAAPAPISKIIFLPDGQCLFAAGPDGVRVVGWEPARLFGSVSRSTGGQHWSPPVQLAFDPLGDRLLVLCLPHPEKLKIVIFAVDIKKFRPFLSLDSSLCELGQDWVDNNANHSPGLSRGKMRRSFVGEKSDKPPTPVDSVENSPKHQQQPTDFPIQNAQEEEILNLKMSFEEEANVFKPKPKLSRSPPPTIFYSAPQSPTIPDIPLEAFNTTFTVQKLDDQQSLIPGAVGPPPPVRKVASPGLARKNSNSKIGAKQPTAIPNRRRSTAIATVSPQISTTKKKVEKVPPLPRVEEPVARPAASRTSGTRDPPSQTGLDPAEFLPTQDQPLSFGDGAACSEESAVQGLFSQADTVATVLQHRARTLDFVRTTMTNRGLRAAADLAIQSNDLGVVVDFLSVLNARYKPSGWNLELCALLLPSIRALLEKYPGREAYVRSAADSLRAILQGFGSVIRHGLSSIPPIGTDVEAEARMSRCRKCIAELTKIREAALERQKIGEYRNRAVSDVYREIGALMSLLDT